MSKVCHGHRSPRSPTRGHPRALTRVRVTRAPVPGRGSVQPSSLISKDWAGLIAWSAMGLCLHLITHLPSLLHFLMGI
ncbi:unnamed protein product [Mycena citricolor]|uniref:Uncharacterized protein n=1 Tax=Mycena citricolor TaxID=2018698 RepID=A0AAD2HBF8_9AGAR|nr:unnamed protein product [Mycena citricolor]